MSEKRGEKEGERIRLVNIKKKIEEKQPTKKAEKPLPKISKLKPGTPI